MFGSVRNQMNSGQIVLSARAFVDSIEAQIKVEGTLEPDM